MIIECENCGTKFKVNKEEIGNFGRMVSCSVCKYEWLYLLKEQDKHIITQNLKEKKAQLEDKDPPEQNNVEVENQIDLEALSNKDKTNISLGIFLLLLSVLLISGILYLERNRLVNQHIYLSKFYRIFDYHDINGLEVIVKNPSKIGNSAKIKEGVAYKIPVSIINTSNQLKHLHAVKVVAYDNKNNIILNLIANIRDNIPAKSKFDIGLKSGILYKEIKKIDAKIGNYHDIKQ